MKITKTQLRKIIKEELEKALHEDENINPADVNVYLLRIVSGVRFEDEPPSHAWGQDRHAKWEQKNEEIDQAIAKINNGNYTKEQLVRAEEQEATTTPHFSNLEKEKASGINIPLPVPRGKLDKIKGFFGLEEEVS
jgi:hypothetical protein